jgi:hypothetical protein
MSGEALKSTPSGASSDRTKIEDCVRGLHRTLPERTPAQLRQLQFHCGKPPPAAEPSTLMRIDAKNLEVEGAGTTLVRGTGAEVVSAR